MPGPHFLRFGCLALGSVVTVACGIRSVNGVPPRDQSPLQTDSLVYHLKRLPGEYRAYVTATFRNQTASPIYFARCNRGSTTPMFGLRRTGSDSARVLFSDFAWACVGGVPTGAINPRDSVMVKVPIGSLDQRAKQPPLRPEHIVGLMRIELSLCQKHLADSDYCDPGPQAQRSSNAFLVTY
jgi:hypothetical protein